jgi:hypothetical protein
MAIGPGGATRVSLSSLAMVVVVVWGTDVVVAPEVLVAGTDVVLPAERVVALESVVSVPVPPHATVHAMVAVSRSRSTITSAGPR